MNELPVSLERTVLIRARRATVFRFFTDSARFASWWGEGSRIEPKPGGEVTIRYPGGVVASGSVVELVHNERIVFTYGYADPEKPIAPGGSLVTITLRDVPGGTELRLQHDVANEAVRDSHAPGWRFQLSLFANAVATEEHAHAKDRIAEWFAAWAEADATARTRLLEAATTDDVTFRDRFACVAGRGELVGHIDAVHRHMAGIALEADGEPRQCQATALVEWVAKAPGGAVVSRGTNVVEMAPDGRIQSVVGVPRSA